MIKLELFTKILKMNSCNFFTGVPDSCLKLFSQYLNGLPAKNHIIAVNEGSAVSMGIGYYLSKKKLACVYMQNSGLGNAINPLISIAHQEVYSIPLILIIGWRGAPNSKDEPQHMAKGRITKNILKLLKIKNMEIRKNSDLQKFNNLIKYAKKNNKIIACLVRSKKFYSQKKLKQSKNKLNPISKEFFFYHLLNKIKKNTAIISSTGYTSRELMYIREKYNLKRGKDFYMVGGMGHTASVASAYSINKKTTTICLDGDGSLLMHLGSIKTAADISKSNFKYVLLNNNCHESVGSQTTNANKVNFNKLSISVGFKNYSIIKNNLNLKKDINNFLKKKGPSFLEVKVGTSINEKLPRPKSLKIIKKNFIK